ncbi:MAG TPA: alpha-glucan family phosphorylase [Ktedonobacterales bacterium]|nr:alpha-glucan family phosphorylase [Ktedonobacterales bacterium]
MKILGRMAVFPVIPARISRLHELAYNLWWSWNADAQQLYQAIDAELWQRSLHNPVRHLREVSPERLQALAEDQAFLAQYDQVMQTFDAYMNDGQTWFAQTHPEQREQTIAYFSMEFGLHESLPIYSGGLGILSGDHCKEASDLGLPLVAVGFLYPQGYFSQRINADGMQEATYNKLRFSEVSATPAVTPDGEEISINVDLPGRKVYAKVWKVAVGRITLLLLDTDVAPNAPNDRVLAAHLYGGDHEMRISQEIVLGIGGVRALRALGLKPALWHMNEGHAAFLGLERIRELMAEASLTFAEAREAVAANAVFTTHTPVPAGNDAFGLDLIDRFFNNFWGQLGLNRDQFIDLARQDQNWGPSFSMTVLALRLSDQHNGVSKLHGDVSRRMWQFLWPGVDVDETPITSITNGVHTTTWLAPALGQFYDRALGQAWRQHVDQPQVWEPIAHASDKELWDIHTQLKAELIAYVRERVKQHRLRLGEGAFQIEEAANLLDPQAFTIGFARRFATYKRATLIFRDLERIRRLLQSTERPVQIIFAGKAHPADEPGKALIQQVYRLSRQPGFSGRVIFLEDYDMDMARKLVSGVDLWLNNPIRPYEASGTSGEKASLNGVPNCSILDGWWVEGYNGKNGWAFGEQREYQNAELQAEADALALYAVLEQDIIPLFFERDGQGLPIRWLRVMKEAIRTLAPAFSMARMVKEYTERFYIPGEQQGQRIAQDHYALARSLADWKRLVMQGWSEVGIWANGPTEGQLAIGQSIDITGYARLANLRPEDVSVEVVYGEDEDGHLSSSTYQRMEQDGQENDGSYRYRAHITLQSGGSFVYGVRILPTHPALLDRYEMGLVKWA